MPIVITLLIVVDGRSLYCFPNFCNLQKTRLSALSIISGALFSSIPFCFTFICFLALIFLKALIPHRGFLVHTSVEQTSLFRSLLQCISVHLCVFLFLFSIFELLISHIERIFRNYCSVIFDALVPVRIKTPPSLRHSCSLLCLACVFDSLLRFKSYFVMLQ